MMRLGANRALTVTEFTSIVFGYADAQEEATEKPSLLRDAFLDLDEIPERVFRGKEWLVLGYKGSGKSAIAETPDPGKNKTRYRL